MTTTENGAHLAGEIDIQPSGTDDTYLDYAAREYRDLVPPAPVPMDVDIAATIGLGYETRELRQAVQALTAAIGEHRRLLADYTTVLRAALAEASTQTARFPLEIAEDAQRAVEESAL